MREFKAGDRVRVKRYCSGARAGRIYTLILYNNGYESVLKTDIGNDPDGGCSCQHNWVLVEEYVKKIKQYGIVKFCQMVGDKRGGPL